MENEIFIDRHRFMMEQEDTKSKKYEIDMEMFKEGKRQYEPKKPTRNLLGKVLSVFCQDKEASGLPKDDTLKRKIGGLKLIIQAK